MEEVIAVDKDFNECRFSRAAWGLVKNKKDYIVFESEEQFEIYWRKKHE